MMSMFPMIDKALALPMFLWLYAGWMIFLMWWLPQLLENLFGNKRRTSPEMREALRIIIKVMYPNR